MVAVSVIVPVYNVEMYLKDCLDRILAQTFRNFEVILVDDGSPDRSGEICDEYAAKDSRVRIIHQANQGQAAARNHAVSQAKGEWLCFVDSDDLIHPQMLEHLYDAAVRGNTTISMCGHVEADEAPSTFFDSCDQSFRVVAMDEKKLLELYHKNQYPSWVIWAKLIRREIVENYPFTEGRVYEDNAVVCRWIYEAKHVAVVEHKLYFYKINQSGTTKSSFSIKKLDYLWALEEIIRFFTEVRYNDLKSIMCTTYAETAAFFHQIVLRELKNENLAQDIVRRLRKIFYENRNYIKLSRKQKLSVYTLLYPKRMRLYWRIVAAAHIIKQDGIVVLIKKLCSHYEEEKENGYS